MWPWLGIANTFAHNDDDKRQRHSSLGILEVDRISEVVWKDWMKYGFSQNTVINQRIGIRIPF